MRLALALALGGRRIAGGLSLSLVANGDESMTATTSGAFAPFSVVANGDESMTATGG